MSVRVNVLGTRTLHDVEVTIPLGTITEIDFASVEVDLWGKYVLPAIFEHLGSDALKVHPHGRITSLRNHDDSVTFTLTMETS